MLEYTHAVYTHTNMLRLDHIRIDNRTNNADYGNNDKSKTNFMRHTAYDETSYGPKEKKHLETTIGGEEIVELADHQFHVVRHVLFTERIICDIRKARQTSRKSHSSQSGQTCFLKHMHRNRYADILYYAHVCIICVRS